MLKTRILTAAVLLLVLLAVIYSGSLIAFSVVLVIFYAGTAWESARLFGKTSPVFNAAIWTVAFAIVVAGQYFIEMTLLFALCAAIWAIRLAPTLYVGLPQLGGIANRLVGGIYAIAVFGCFIAIAVLFQNGALYLLSAFSIVWVADVGAYFFGKALGRHKLAPSISPGKSWEGALGGWLSVVVFAWAAANWDTQGATFFSRVQDGWGMPGLVVVMTILVIASVVGDLFESLLKRRIGMKDSSNLLPGHGGILDRVDALIPVLPVVVLLDWWI